MKTIIMVEMNNGNRMNSRDVRAITSMTMIRTERRYIRDKNEKRMSGQYTPIHFVIAQ